MKSGKARIGLVIAGCAAALWACGRTEGGVGGTPKASPPSGELVASVGDSGISLSEFEAQMNQQNPLIRARYNTLEQKKKLLDNLVEREAMVLEAKRLGLEQDPEFIRGYHKILARQLVQREFNEKRAKEITVPEEEIAKYYEENLDRYRAPEKLRVHLILFGAPAGDAKARKVARAKAEEALKQLRADPNNRRLFFDLARERSDDADTKESGGDVNFQTQAQLVERYGKVVADAAAGLLKANDLSPVVEGERGFFLLRQSGRQAAIDLSLDKVKGQIRTTLFARKRGEAYEAFVAEVKGRVGVQVFEEVLGKAKVDTSGMPQPTPGMPLAPPKASPGDSPMSPQPGPKPMPRPLPAPKPKAPPAGR